MKRSSFLKALLGIAVAPVAIAKAMEGSEVLEESHQGTDGWIHQIKNDDSYLFHGDKHYWYDLEEVKAHQRWNEELEQARFSGEPIASKQDEWVSVKAANGNTYHYRKWPILFPDEKTI